MAEIAGAFAADGCMQKGYICMWGNITEDRDYYDTVLSELYFKEFGVKVRVHPKASNSVYGFYLCRREVVSFFNKVLGFPIGSKTYIVTVPNVVMNNISLYPSFIRGYADNDGCITFSKLKGTASLFRKIRHTYPRILISSVSYEIIKQLKYMLDCLDIHSTLIIKKLSTKQKVPIKVLTIRGAKQLSLWMDKIGFSNPAHKTKVDLWKRFGYCPTKTTIAQRKAVLSGTLDISTFYEKNGPGRIRTDDLSLSPLP